LLFANTQPDGDAEALSDLAGFRTQIVEPNDLVGNIRMVFVNNKLGIAVIGFA